MLPLLKTVMAMKPKTVKESAPCQEVVLTGDDIDLGQAADPDLLAGRAGAADHLAAGGDQGAVSSAARTTSTSASTACR
jgi:hypothetical protein